GARHGDEPGPGELPWRVGGRVAFTVDAASFPASSGQLLEVYLRIPPATIGQLGRDSLRAARLRLTARVRGSGGRHETVHEVSIVPGDTLGGLGKVVVLRFPVHAGGHRLLVRIDDPGSRKRGIVYVGRQVTESGQVEGQIAVPAPQASRDLSDVAFLWTQ